MRLFKLMADAQEQIIRSPYPDLLLEMIVVRMATLAPVMDADELLRALGAAGGAPPAAPSAASGGSGSGTRAPARVPDPEPAPSAGARRLRVEGEVKADAPLRAAGAPALTSTATAAAATPPPPASAMSAPSRLAPLGAPRAAAAPAGSADLLDLPELREHIRARRAALAGFMEQGASLALDGDLLRVIPRNDIYIRYLNDNRASIGELASELYGRKLRVEVSVNGAAGAATGGAVRRRPWPRPSARFPPGVAGVVDGATQSVAPSPTSAAAYASSRCGSGGGESAAAPARSIATDRQALYADPVVRRIFEELQGRLVEVRERPPPHPRHRLKRRQRSARQRAMIRRRQRCGAPHRSNTVPDEFDFSAMLRQAQALQEKLKQLQIEAGEKTVEAQSGGGMVRVVVDGAMRVRKIEIDPSIAAADDKAMMEDLIVVAVNDGLRRAQELVAAGNGQAGADGRNEFARHLRRRPRLARGNRAHRQNRSDGREQSQTRRRFAARDDAAGARAFAAARRGREDRLAPGV